MMRRLNPQYKPRAKPKPSASAKDSKAPDAKKGKASVAPKAPPKAASKKAAAAAAVPKAVKGKRKKDQKSKSVAEVDTTGAEMDTTEEEDQEFYEKGLREGTIRPRDQLPRNSTGHDPHSGIDPTDMSSPLSRMVNIIRSKNKGPSPAEETEEDANDNGARGRAAREGMEPDEYYRLHSHLHPPESVLKQFDKHPLAVQVRQSHSV